MRVPLAKGGDAQSLAHPTGKEWSWSRLALRVGSFKRATRTEIPSRSKHLAGVDYSLFVKVMQGCF
jgi:hypothetical protein